MDFCKETLANKGYKFTSQRRAVYDIIAAAPGKHFTAEEIYNIVRESYSGIGIATVYRTLQVLEELELIKKDYLAGGVVRYEIKHSEEEHAHHHLICLGCGEILEAREDLMEAIEDLIEKQYKFRVTDHNIKFYGFCLNCSEKE